MDFCKNKIVKKLKLKFMLLFYNHFKHISIKCGDNCEISHLSLASCGNGNSIILGDGIKLKDVTISIFGNQNQLGSAELFSVHRQRVADVAPHSDDNDEKPPDFGQGKTKFPQELHHVFDEVAHSRPASCCIWKLGSYVIGSIDSLASTE